MSLPAIIIAGGYGTRIAAVAGNKPKSLIQICEKPFLYWQLDLLFKNGVEDVVLCLSHRAEQIMEYLSYQNDIQVNIHYCLDGDTQLGTGGSAKKAISLVKGPCFVLYGDSYLLADFSKIKDFYIKQSKQALMTTIHHSKTYEKPNVEMSQNKIVAYSKSRAGVNMKYLDYGLSILTSDCFDFSQGLATFDLSEVFSNLILRDEVVGYETDQKYFEIGSTRGFSEFKNYMERENSAQSEF